MSEELSSYLQGLVVTVRKMRRFGATWGVVAMALNTQGRRRTGPGGTPWTGQSVQSWYQRHSGARRASARRALLSEVELVYRRTRSYVETARVLCSKGWRTLHGRPITRKHVRNYLTLPRYGLRERFPELLPQPVFRKRGRRRPEYRSQCADGPRPCPWVGCRYHLALNVWRRDSGAGSPSAGVVLSRPEVANGDLSGVGYEGPDGWVSTTCALDVADEGALSLAQVAEIEGTSREWSRKLYRIAEASLTERDPEVAGLLRARYEHSKASRWAHRYDRAKDDDTGR